MLGLLLWSLHYIMQHQNDFLGCVLFSVLLNMKHLFVYAAPVYLVYTLRHYCVGRRSLLRFIAVGSGVAAVFGVSFGPFLAMGQMKQVRPSIRGSAVWGIKNCATTALFTAHATAAHLQWNWWN